MHFEQQLHLNALGSRYLCMPTIRVWNSPLFGLEGVMSFEYLEVDSVFFPGLSLAPSDVGGFTDATFTEFILLETTSEDFSVSSSNKFLSPVSRDNVASGTFLVDLFGLIFFTLGDDVATGFSMSSIVTSVTSGSAGFAAVVAPLVSITTCPMTPSCIELNPWFAILFSSITFCIAICVSLGYCLLSSGFHVLH